MQGGRGWHSFAFLRSLPPCAHPIHPRCGEKCYIGIALRTAQGAGYREDKTMRCYYREKQTVAGNYLQVDIYPVFAKAGARRKKRKPTSEVQQKLNEKHSRERIVMLANANFTPQDIRLDLTFRPDALPENADEAQRVIRNFFRRLKRYRKSAGLPELKYICVLEASPTGRYHFHLIMSGGVDMRTLSDLWGLGIICTAPLEFNENGIAELVNYITKNTGKNERRVSASRNLKNPSEKTVDGRLTQKKVQELAGLTDCAAEFEALYPGYRFDSASPFWNDYNAHQYLTVRMYREHHQNRRRRI